MITDHGSQRAFPHHLLDARHRARDVLAEHLLPEQLHDARLCEHRAGPRFEVSDVKADAAALQRFETRSAIDQRLSEPGETCVVQ